MIRIVDYNSYIFSFFFLRKGGESKLIRIYHHKGKYGFAEPYQFNSVPELIDYHRKCSLKEYNAHLDVRLLYPICREVWVFYIMSQEVCYVLRGDLFSEDYDEGEWMNSALGFTKLPMVYFCESM